MVSYLSCQLSTARDLATTQYLHWDCGTLSYPHYPPWQSAKPDLFDLALKYRPSLLFMIIWSHTVTYLPLRIYGTVALVSLYCFHRLM